MCLDGFRMKFSKSIRFLPICRYGAPLPRTASLVGGNVCCSMCLSPIYRLGSFHTTMCHQLLPSSAALQGLHVAPVYRAWVSWWLVCSSQLSIASSCDAMGGNCLHTTLSCVLGLLVFQAFFRLKRVVTCKLQSTTRTNVCLGCDKN